jgi:coniferyl-aldehyde dehydrogenase
VSALGRPGKHHVLHPDLAPDYVLAPANKIGGFVEAAKSAVTHMFPRIRDNPDYTAVNRHYARLTGYVDDARAKGAEIVEINPAGEDLRSSPIAASHRP